MAEDQITEYKESWRDEYLRQICGLANTHGGSLLVGVDDNGKVVGVRNAKLKVLTGINRRAIQKL